MESCGTTHTLYCGEAIVTTPVSILGELACACFDGQLHLIDLQTGKLFDQIPTGHSPYSALTFWNDKAYLGGGDPPYHGKLYCFEFIDRSSSREYQPNIIIQSEKYDNRKLSIAIEILNSPHEILKIHLDTSAISAEQTNGGIYQSNPISRSGRKFYFIVPIRESIVPGVYPISCHLLIENGIHLSRGSVIYIKTNQNRPRIHLLPQITPISQENIFYSGAAVMQMLQAYYKQPITPQQNIREMVDYSRNISHYEPFNVWRIILRRIISSNAQSKNELPEYKTNST